VVVVLWDVCWWDGPRVTAVCDLGLVTVDSRGGVGCGGYERVLGMGWTEIESRAKRDVAMV